MQRNGTQKARSVPRIVTTIKPKKNYKEVSFKNKREEREICINSEESHFYLQMCRKIFHQEKSSTRAHLVSIARKSRTYYGSMSARNISQQCTKPWRIVWEKSWKEYYVVYDFQCLGKAAGQTSSRCIWSLCNTNQRKYPRLNCGNAANAVQLCSKHCRAVHQEENKIWCYSPFRKDWPSVHRATPYFINGFLSVGGGQSFLNGLYTCGKWDESHKHFHKLDNAQATQKWVMIMPDANQTKLQKAHSCNAFDVKAMSLDFAPYTSDCQLQKKAKNNQKGVLQAMQRLWL